MVTQTLLNMISYGSWLPLSGNEVLLARFGKSRVKCSCRLPLRTLIETDSEFPELREILERQSVGRKSGARIGVVYGEGAVNGSRRMVQYRQVTMVPPNHTEPTLPLD